MTRVSAVARFLFGIGPFLFLGFSQGDSSDVETQYRAAKVSDPVSAMVARINDGTRKLAYEPNQGYLRSVLSQLEISPTTQILVFSKTSVQSAYISPTSPRAIYFNDRSYVGWIRGAPNIELVGIDPQVGPIFYTLSNQPSQKPAFVHQTDECLQCHDSGMTSHVPGLMARSVYAGPDGALKLAGGSFVTTATSPMKERWGGWYVTGHHGDQRHMGNEPARGDDQNPVIDTDKGANVTDLRSYFDVESYLMPDSDIVALMVAEQQMAIQNLITQAAYLSRKAMKDAAELRKFGFSDEHVTSSTLDRLRNACEPLVLALTGAGEPKLTSPVKGTSRFASVYSTSAPADKLGRRLSELDLKTRLLKFPCSPMIYSRAFNELPKDARSLVLTRLGEVLTGKDKTKPYADLNREDCKTALEILRDTIPSADLHDFGSFL